MLITHKLDEPCPSCGQVGQYGNVNVGDNLLNRGCNSCNGWFRYPLPELRKEIIYLDQFFLSHAFRQQERPFVEAAERIKELAARQLLVCPYSSVHTDETHLWRHEQQEELYKFIKQTARGHKFSQSYEIKGLDHNFGRSSIYHRSIQQEAIKPGNYHITHCIESCYPIKTQF